MNSPFFGNPAIRLCDRLTRGFASPPHDGFAVLGKGLRWRVPIAMGVPSARSPSVRIRGSEIPISYEKRRAALRAKPAWSTLSDANLPAQTVKILTGEPPRV